MRKERDEEQVFEATALDEESVVSDEDWTEAQEEESDYPLEEAEYADEEAEYDDESLIDPDEEEVDWASLESEEATGIPAGREEVAKVPLLKSHRGSGPDLILSWNDMAGQPQSVDVVVHLHGYSLRAGKLLNISRDIVPRSGLDWSDPEKVDRTPGRSEPTLTLLPRGHFFGGKSGRGYSFPALVTETGLKQLIDFGLGHFARHISATNVALRRLIISSHSGGAAALLRILRHNDPREVHVFDGMYQDPAELVRWAKARIERDSKALEAGAESPERYMLERGGALRVLFRPGSATERYSLTVDNALLAAIPAGSPMRRWYRVEQTSLGHLLIPRRYGWRLLANAAAELPGASAPRQARTKELAFEEEAPARVIFPSGESLGVLTGLPEAKDQDYWDPTGSGNPLLDTGTAQKNKKLSPSFTVRELTTSGGVSADIGRIDPKLVESLQRLKDHVGKGVTITSGYRSWKRNKQVYAGRKNRDGTPKKPTLSQHCGGRAADITITGMNGLDIGKAAIDACGPNIGVGLGNTFAHIDVRGFAAAWNYGGVKDSWIAEIKRYQQAKGGKGKPPPAGLATAKGSPPRTSLQQPARDTSLSTESFVEEDLLQGEPLSRTRIELYEKGRVRIKESPSVFVPAIIRLAWEIARQEKAVDVIAKLDPGRWFQQFTRRINFPNGKTDDFTFLGRKLRPRQYIHVELARLLKKVEAEFVQDVNAPPKNAGDILLLGSDELISGTRAKSATAKYSYHMFGLAVDVNYKGNPFIQKKAFRAIDTALKNAALLMNREVFASKHNTTGKFKDRFDYIKASDDLLESLFPSVRRSSTA